MRDKKDNFQFPKVQSMYLLKYEPGMSGQHWHLDSWNKDKTVVMVLLDNSTQSMEILHTRF